MFNNKDLKNTLIFISILILAAALRVHNLDRYSLWYDEAISPLQEGGMMGLPCVTKLFDRDFAVKNPYYLAMYNYSFICYWQALFGKSEFALRMSSVLLSLLAISLLYFLARPMFNTKTAWIAAFLLAISPFHIYYSQELRPYAAVGFFTLLCVYSLLQILNGNGRIRWWFVYGISSVANVYFLYVNLLFLLLFLPLFIYKINNLSIKRFIVTHLTMLVSLVPALLIIYHSLVFVFTCRIAVDTNEFPAWSDEKVGIKNLVFMIKNFSVGYHIDYYSLIGIVSTYAYFFIFCLGIIKFWKNEKMRFLLFCFLAPLAAIFFASMIKDCYVYRYSFAVLPLFILVIAAGLGSVGKRALFFLLMLISLLSIYGVSAFYANHLPAGINQYTGVREKQNIRAAVKALVADYTEGDRILQVCRSTVFPLKFYARQFHAGDALLAEVDRGSVVHLSESGLFLVYDYSSMHPLVFLQGDCKSLDNFNDANRICLVFSSWRFSDLGEKDYGVISKLKEGFTETEVKRFPDIELHYFKKK